MKKLIKIAIIVGIFIMIGGIGYAGTLLHKVSDERAKFTTYTSQTLPDFKSLKGVTTEGTTLNITYKTINGANVNKSINAKDIPNDYNNYLQLAAKARIWMFIAGFSVPIILILLGILRKIIKIIL